MEHRVHKCIGFAGYENPVTVFAPVFDTVDVIFL